MYEIKIISLEYKYVSYMYENQLGRVHFRHMKLEDFRTCSGSDVVPCAERVFYVEDISEFAPESKKSKSGAFQKE
jgi:hypothetical protein